MRSRSVGTLLVLVLLATMLTGILGAEAEVTNVAITDFDTLNGRVVDISGFISCTPGMRFFVQAEVKDISGNVASGVATGICQGAVGPAGGGGSAPPTTPWNTARERSETGFTEVECVQGRARGVTPADDGSDASSGFVNCNGGSK